MTKFNVVINPFSRKILVWARINKVDCDVVLDWNGEDDWWADFSLNDKFFMCHIYYEGELSVCVYDKGSDSYTLTPYPISFKLTHKDEF